MSKPAKIDVIINDEMAKARLQDIKKELSDIKKMKDKAMADGDTKAFNQLNNEWKKLTAEARQYERKVIDVNQVLKNLSSASVRELKAALQQSNRELDAMKRNDPGYSRQEQKVKSLRMELDRATASARVHQSTMVRLADGFNRYFTIATTFVASITGVVLGLNKAKDEFNKYEEKLDEVSALTGLTGEQLKGIGEDAKKMSIATVEGGIRIKQSAVDILEAFKLVGSAKPELLKNSEALKQVTQDAIILNEAAKGELKPTVEALANTMNQFGASADESRRYINVLAAGAKEGAAEVPDLSASIIKFGAAAAAANISVEESVALVESLAEKGVKGEIAGTQLRGVLLRLQSGARDTNPAIVGMNTALENLAKKNLSAADMVKLFGMENYVAGQILVANRDRYKELTTAVTRTNVAVEQAALNTDNNNAKLAQAKNRISLVAMELGEKLTPAYTFSTNSLGYFLRGMVQGIKVFNEYKSIIVPAVIALTGYVVAAKLATLWTDSFRKASILQVIQQKISSALTTISTAGTYAFAIAQALLAGNIGRAAAAWRMFNVTLATSGIGLAVAVIGAAVSAFMMMGEKAKANNAILTKSAEIQKKYNEQLEDERAKTEQLASVAKNESLAKNIRLKALKELKEQAGGYLDSLTLENIKTAEGAKALKDYNDELERKIFTEAIAEEKTDLIKKRYKAEVRIEKSKEALDNPSGPISKDLAKKGIGIAEYELAAIDEQLAKLDKRYEDLVGGSKTTSTDKTKPPAGPSEDEIKAAETAYKKLLDIRKQASDSEIALMKDGIEKEKALVDQKYKEQTESIQHELDKNSKLTVEERTLLNQTLVNLGKKHIDDIAKLDKEKERKEIEFNKQLTEITLAGVREGSAEEHDLKKQLINQQMQLEINALTGSEEQKALLTEAIRRKFTKQINEEDLRYSKQFLDDKLRDDVRALTDAEQKKLEALKQKRASGEISQRQYNKQLLELQAQFTKDSLQLAIEKAERELAILKASGEDITQAEEALAALRLKIQETETSKETGKGSTWKDWSTKDKLNAAVDAAKSIADAEFQIKRDQNQKELNDNLAKLAEERENAVSNKRLTEKQKETISKEYDKKEKAIRKAAWEKQHKADLAQAWVNMALMVGKAAINAWPVPAIPLMAAAAIEGGAQIAIVAKQKPEFSSGGYTNKELNDQVPSGIVHANEFVGNADAVRNPSVRKVFDIIDYAQKHGTISQINLPAVVAATTYRSRQVGGYVSDNTAPASSNGSSSNPIVPPDMITAMNRFSDSIERLHKDGVKGKWSLWDLEKIQKDKATLESETSM